VTTYWQTSRIALAATVIAVAACKARSSAPPTKDPQVAPAAAPTPPASPSGGPQPSLPDPVVPHTAKAGLEVSTFLQATFKSGDEVTLHGRCLRIDALAAFGPPPRSRSDWQLADVSDSTKALWVAGPRPTDCTSAASSAAAMTLRARVAVDTVNALNGSPVVRRYVQTHP
jgi:hypothetical protein